jgi:hypothetical protein
MKVKFISKKEREQLKIEREANPLIVNHNQYSTPAALQPEVLLQQYRSEQVRSTGDAANKKAE